MSIALLWGSDFASSLWPLPPPASSFCSHTQTHRLLITSALEEPVASFIHAQMSQLVRKSTYFYLIEIDWLCHRSPPVLLDLPLPLAVPLLSVLLLFPLQLHSLLLEALPLLHRLLSFLLLPHLLFTLKTGHRHVTTFGTAVNDFIINPDLNLGLHMYTLQSSWNSEGQNW